MKILKFIFCILFFSACQTPMSKVLKKYGLDEVRPAATFWKPSTIVRVNQMPGFGHLLYTRVCSQEEAFRKSVEYDTSLSTEVIRDEKLTRVIEIEGNTENQIKKDISAEVKVDAVKKISLKFSQVKILSMTDATIFANISNKKAHCATAIAEARKDKNFRQVGVVTYALVGDYSVIVEWDDSVNLDARLKSNIEAIINAKVLGEGTESTRGKNLIWAIDFREKFLNHGN